MHFSKANPMSLAIELAEYEERVTALDAGHLMNMKEDNSMVKSTSITLYCKEPDVFGDMSHDLKLTESKRRKYLDCGEYATIELEVDSNMNIIGGRFLPIYRT